MLLLLLWSCTGATDTDTERVDDTNAWTWSEETGETEALWTAEEVAEAIESTMDGGIPTTADLWRASWVVVEVAESECGWSARGFKDLLGCETDTGWYLYGFVHLSTYPIDKAPQTGAYRNLVSDFIVIDDEARTFDGGGEAVWAQATDSSLGTTQISMELEGTWTVEAADEWVPEAPGNRLDETLSALLTLDTTVTPNGNISALDGGVSIGTLPPLVFETFEWGLSCEGGPSGVIRTRDSTGRWYDLVLSADTCDGCGTVLYDDQSLGEACVDLGEDLDATVASLQVEVEDMDTGL